MSARFLLGALFVVAVLGGLAAVARDDFNTHQQAVRQAQRGDQLARELATARAQVSVLSSQAASLQATNSQLESQARNPTLAMWNSCGGPCTISPSGVRVGAVPDTFQLQIDLTATVPVRGYVFTFAQWAQFDTCGLSTRCVSGSYTTYGPTTSMQEVFDQAEGCSAYVWVLQSDGTGTITPDVRVRYQPASQPTGVCAGNP